VPRPISAPATRYHRTTWKLALSKIGLALKCQRAWGVTSDQYAPPARKPCPSAPFPAHVKGPESAPVSGDDRFRKRRSGHEVSRSTKGSKSRSRLIPLADQEGHQTNADCNVECVPDGYPVGGRDGHGLGFPGGTMAPTERRRSLRPYSRRSTVLQPAWGQTDAQAPQDRFQRRPNLPQDHVRGCPLARTGGFGGPDSTLWQPPGSWNSGPAQGIRKAHPGNGLALGPQSPHRSRNQRSSSVCAPLPCDTPQKETGR